MFIREALFLFILCGLFFILLFLLYMRVRELRKENDTLRDIMERYVSQAKKGEEKEECSGENPLCINSGDTYSVIKTESDSD
jgi:hypothetical protein